jgi:NADH dehydrogenase
MHNTLVTVFGGSGFLGRHTVRALAKAGYRVRVAVRHPRSAFFLPPMGQVGQIQLFKANVVDADQVAAALRGASAVVNLTGILYQSGEQTFEAIQTEAPGTIAAAASVEGIKTLVHVSAIGADANAKSRYAQSKGDGEASLREAFPDAAILRPSLLFGPEDDFFNKFAWLARLAPALPLIGGGHTKFQPVFVGDVAEAILRCIENPGTRAKTYELGGPTVYSFKDLMRIVLRETGRKRLLIPVPFFAARIKAFFLQMSKIVGIKPLLTMDQVTLLETDNVVSDGALTLADLGIVPDSLEAVVPEYLWRFRPKGQFQEVATSRAPTLP